MKYKRVYPTTDDDGHWYVLPYELRNKFITDVSDDSIVDNGIFDDRYGKYRTGGSLNLVEFYIKDE